MQNILHTHSLLEHLVCKYLEVEQAGRFYCTTRGILFGAWLELIMPGSLSKRQFRQSLVVQLFHLHQHSPRQITPWPLT